MALLATHSRVELREITFKDKPKEMLLASPKATVPVMVLPDGSVIDESLDIMLWALTKNDPDGWMQGNLAEMLALIDTCEEDFKGHLDRYKYANRYVDADPTYHRDKACEFLSKLEEQLKQNIFLYGESARLADMAIAPFVRQFANTDRAWFDDCPYPHVREWALRFMDSNILLLVMKKYPVWQKGDDKIIFGR